MKKYIELDKGINKLYLNSQGLRTVERNFHKSEGKELMDYNKAFELLDDIEEVAKKTKMVLRKIMLEEKK